MYCTNVLCKSLMMSRPGYIKGPELSCTQKSYPIPRVPYPTKHAFKYHILPESLHRVPYYTVGNIYNIYGTVSLGEGVVLSKII